MIWLFIGIIILLLVVGIVFRLKLGGVKESAESDSLSYEKLESLFTPGECSFLGVLNQVIGESAVIFGKVRIADVITPQKSKNRSKWQKAFNKINSKHFDYILCDKTNFSVICVIELNDKSHNSSKCQLRDKFVEKACSSASLPLVTVDAKSAYEIVAVKELLAPFLKANNKPQQVSGNLEKTEIENDSVINKISKIDVKNKDIGISYKKICPKCSSIMVKKIAKKGAHSGKEFWACSAYPKCRSIEEV